MRDSAVCESAVSAVFVCVCMVVGGGDSFKGMPVVYDVRMGAVRMCPTGREHT